MKPSFCKDMATADKEYDAILRDNQIYLDKCNKLQTELAAYKNAEKFVSDPPHDQVCCGCVAILRKQLVAAEEQRDEYEDLLRAKCPKMFLD